MQCLHTHVSRTVFLLHRRTLWSVPCAFYYITILHFRRSWFSQPLDIRELFHENVALLGLGHNDSRNDFLKCFLQNIFIMWSIIPAVALVTHGAAEGWGAPAGSPAEQTSSNDQKGFNSTICFWWPWKLRRTRKHQKPSAEADYCCTIFLFEYITTKLRKQWYK